MARVIYGFPTPAALEAAERGEVVLDSGGLPTLNRQCRRCGARFGGGVVVGGASGVAGLVGRLFRRK